MAEVAYATGPALPLMNTEKPAILLLFLLPPFLCPSPGLMKVEILAVLIPPFPTLTLDLL